MKTAHTDDCGCDGCIKVRTRLRLAQRELDSAQAAYEKRRGAPIGGISVAQALRKRRR